MVESLAPFFPSSPDIVRMMLRLASTSKDDIILDLGCGDGRILIMAVKEFGAKKAVGYEMRPELYRETLNKVMQMGLGGRIVLYNDDLMRADLREATVITVYLTTDGNEKLRPKLLKDARKGTRIVSHDFVFDKWNPTAVEEWNGHTLYLYAVPDSYSPPNSI
jgi:16S rRNA A1518/A1519 N6-dimethyltransferase RsmA/KsgA/DIM1 with predicted DNA glycosylase/AP lyase activity